MIAVRPRIALTTGDPNGIGPEVLVRALAAQHPRPFDVQVFGHEGAVQRAADEAGLPAPDLRAFAGDLPEWEALESAIGACLAGDFDALVTGPIHKRRMMDGGFPFVGHTELLAARAGGDDGVVMAFAGGVLRVALLTTHLPLSQVPRAISADEVLRVARVFDRGLRNHFGLDRPCLALCGLNPHAGEEGRLGHEDAEILAPGVERAREQGIDLIGPLPADTLFARAVAGGVDGVVACYHDQGLAAVKAVDFGRSVNITLGLPFVRTSPDHGTAYDIAGRGIADPSSMSAALRMAVACVDGARV